MEEVWRHQRLTSEELDGKIAAWHDAPSDSYAAHIQLHEYLGWSWGKFKRWAESGIIDADN